MDARGKGLEKVLKNFLDLRFRNHWIFLYGSILSIASVFYFTLLPFEPKDFSSPHEISWHKILDLSFIRSSDFVPNIFLFIPLTYFLSGYFWQVGITVNSAVKKTLIILLAALALSICNEGLELFNTRRICSLSDILAQIFGSIIGVFFWHLHLLTANCLLIKKNLRFKLIYTLLIAILLELSCTCLLLILNAEVTLKEFLFFRTEELRLRTSVLLNFLYFSPLGFLVVLLLEKAQFKLSKSALLLPLGLLIGTVYQEILEHVLGYRISIFEVLSITAAVWAGSLPLVAMDLIITIYRYFPSRIAQFIVQHLNILIFAYVTFLIFEFASGSRFETPAEVYRKLEMFHRLPFVNYYHSNYLACLESLLKKGLAFFPLGILIMTHLLKRDQEIVCLRAVLKVSLPIILLGLIIEYLQVYIIGRYPDITDVIVYMIAAQFGALVHCSIATGTFYGSYGIKIEDNRKE